MAQAKIARIVSTADVGSTSGSGGDGAAGGSAGATTTDTRHLTLEMIDPPRLDFLGGQYVIVDSGIVLPSGKAAKRAYSIFSADTEQRRFELAVMRLPGGPASGFLHEQEVGAQVRFSGPWGKLYLPPEVERVESAPLRPTLLLASDTGITALLGLARGQRFAPLLRSCTFVWLRTSPRYFLSEAFVFDRLPAGLREIRIADLPPLDHPERIAVCRRLLRDVHARAPLGQAFLAGDGAINYALLDDLEAAGIPATRDSVESFFNMPKATTRAPAAS
jgi:ferredoxin-NADP reductase